MSKIYKCKKFLTTTSALIRCVHWNIDRKKESWVLLWVVELTQKVTAFVQEPSIIKEQ